MFLKQYFEKVFLKKSAGDNRNMKKIPSLQIVKYKLDIQ